MQINRRSEGAPSAPASQDSRTQGVRVTQARTRPATAATSRAVPKPGDMVSISGKQEEFIGVSFDNDHIRVHTVTDSTRGTSSPIRGTHTRFFYCESSEMAAAPTQGAASQSGTGQSSGRADPDQRREAPRTPQRTNAGSVGPQRTPRAARISPVTVRTRARAEPAQSSNMALNTERRINNDARRTVKPNKQTVEHSGWDSALLHDAAHIHGFDAGPSFLDQESLLSSRPLGPSGTEYC